MSPSVDIGLYVTETILIPLRYTVETVAPIRQFSQHLVNYKYVWTE